MLQKVGEKVQADFVLSAQDDGRYGMQEEDGSWNGMIGSVVNGDATLAAGDITVTAARERAVDFTVPFMQTGDICLECRLDCNVSLSSQGSPSCIINPHGS